MRIDKNKDEKKQDWRKPFQIEKDKDPDLQGDGRKKLPQMVLLTSRRNSLNRK